MRALSVTELLSAWERAYAQRPAQRALTLVRAACADEDIDPGALAVGERDARLLTLRERTFGPTLRSVGACDACGEKMELSFTTENVRAPAADARAVHELEADGYRLEWRLPTSAEIAALSPEEGIEGASARLEATCVLRAARAEEAIAPSDLPASVRDALAQAVADADPQADIELTVACPACARASIVPFDVATFFWDELNDWARRILRDVHAIASAYGWSEREILGMSPFRRQLYLEMLGE